MVKHPSARFTRRVLAAAVAASLTPLAHAAEATADAAVRLDTQVVTAAGFEQELAQAPASISVITREELQQKGISSIAEALDEIEGVDVEASVGKTGGMNISIRGMPSDYTLILIDGRRQNAAGNVTPNGFGETQTSFMPPISAIERIEVVRGPMSTLYGSDAMGGVVNIITRKVADHWHGGVTHGFTVQQESDQFGNDRTTDLYVAGPLIADRLGIAVRGSYYDQDESIPEWDPLPLPSPPNEPGSVWERTLGFGGGGKQVASTRWNGGLRLSYAPNERHDLRLEYALIIIITTSYK